MSAPNQAIGLNGRLAARWARRAVERLRKERADIDELNVFPVPDGDTGTNLYRTLRSAYLAVEELSGPVTLPQVVTALATGASKGARGNSGLILSVALSGVAEALEGVTVADSESMAGALELASQRARAAVARPVDGTMLTVLDAMATEARERADADSTLVDLVSAVRVRSRSALRETTSQLEVLSDADVVDAGSTGIVELFDLLYATVTGRTPQDSMLTEVSRAPRIVHEARADELEIVAILEARTDTVTGAGDVYVQDIAEVLLDMGGTSVVINELKVHVHVEDEAGAANILDYLSRFGIARLDMEDLRLHEAAGETRLIAVVSGTGLLMHCALNGATALSPRPVGEGETIAELAAEDDRDVIVIPSSATTVKTLSVLRGLHLVRSRNVATLLSALAVYDPYAAAVEIYADMTEAAAGTRVGTIINAKLGQTGSNPTAANTAPPAQRNAHPSYFYRVLIEGKPRTQSSELTTMVEKLADRLLGAGGELLTVVHGRDCPVDVLEHLRTWIQKSHTQVRMQEIASGDRSVLVIMGVE